MGYGALVALKYFYPSFKKFLVRRFGDKIAVDSNFQKQLALSMPEVIRMLGNVQIPPSGGGGIRDEKKEGEKEENKEVSNIPRRQ